MTATTSARPVRTLARWASALTAPLVVSAMLLVPGAAPHPTGDQLEAVATTASPTTFKVATFNVLGNSHTTSSGDKAGQYLGGRKRMDLTTQIIKDHGVSLIGMQEFEPVQYDEFHANMGSAWGVWPGTQVGDNAVTDSLAWRTADWTAIKRTTYQAPYFYGKMKDHPLVLLRHNRSGQLVWLMNTHNPANTWGDAQKWRDESERIQAALVNKLQKADPEIPVLFTGDMNDRSKFYCPVTFLTDLESASGGVHGDPSQGDDYVCEPHTPVSIDWIMGTSNIGFSGYTEDDSAVVDKASDHPFIFATASIAPQPARAAGIKRVVVVDIQGLRSSAVTLNRTPTVTSLKANGSATLQARSDNESRSALPNAIGVLSSRPVDTDLGGHGVRTSSYRGTTVAAAAGQYVSSIYDMAHNLGMRTAFYSGDPRADLVTRSWDSSLTATDKYGVDNGRGKIDSRRVASSDSDIMSAAHSTLRSTRPARLTVVQLGNPLRAGQAHGFTSSEYTQAVKTADVRLKSLLDDVRGNAATAGHTAIIVTSSGPGSSATLGYGVPLVVWGPGVARGRELYAMNGQYTRPTDRQKVPSSGSPLRVGAIGNLVTELLTLPAIPRSRINSHQGLDVFGR